MQNTGNLNSLTEKLKAKTEQDRQAIETLTQQQFEALSESLSESSKSALSTTEAAIQAQLTALEKSVANHCRILNRIFGKKLLQTLLLSFALFLSLTLGGWGLVRWEANQFLGLHKEAEQLKTHIASLEQTHAQLESKTWNLELLNNEKGRFIILPSKVTPKIGWTFGNRPAIKLE